jgi:hypothetical protein
VHVCGLTQIHGSTFDLVVTHAHLKQVNVDVEPFDMFSDHALVVCRCRSLSSQPLSPKGWCADGDVSTGES